MPNVIDDIALPRGTWVRLTTHGPADRLTVMNRGFSEVLVKKGGAAAPTGDAGAMALPPGNMLPPEDTRAFSLDVWAMSPHSDGVVAVEALRL